MAFGITWAIHSLYAFRGRDGPAQVCTPDRSSQSDQVAVLCVSDLRDPAAEMALPRRGDGQSSSAPGTARHPFLDVQGGGVVSRRVGRLDTMADLALDDGRTQRSLCSVVGGLDSLSLQEGPQRINHLPELLAGAHRAGPWPPLVWRRGTNSSNQECRQRRLLALGRPIPPLVLSEDEVQQLQALASSRSLPHSIVQRAQIMLACGAGVTNTAIAKRMGLTGMTVGKGRKRYRELGLEGLHDELRPGRPRTMRPTRSRR
jgi:hypothetical protein